MGWSKLNLKHAMAIAISGIIALAVPIGDIVAQQQSPGTTGQALEISPTLVTMDVDPGESTSIEIRLRNVSTEDLIVSGVINDFVASGEGGSPRIIIDDEEREEMGDNPYSFIDWVEPLPQVLLEPNQIETFAINLQVPSNASPGGHYGAIRYTGTAPELEGTGVSLSTSVGTLVLLTVSGDVEEQIEVAEFVASKNDHVGTIFESAPLQLIQRIENTGNVHVQPRGQVFIRDMFGRDLAAANVNLARSNILPSSIRRFEQEIDSSLIGNKRLFGRYSAELELNYGDDQVATASLSFWVIPYRLIGAIILLLIIAYLGVLYLLKRYKQRIIKQTRQQNRRKS